MKSVLRKLLLLVALPIALVVVLYILLRGGPGCLVCDPVHPGKVKPEGGSKPSTQPTQPDGIHPPVCDPVHVPPASSPEKK
jgi:hypothetical protein